MKIDYLASDQDFSCFEQFRKDFKFSQLTDSLTWTKFISESMNIETYTFGISNGDMKTGLLNLGLVSHPFFGKYLVTGPYGGLGGFLAKDQDSARCLLKHASDLAIDKKVDYVHVRGLIDQPCEVNWSIGPSYCSYRLPLIHEDHIWSDMMSATVRNQTRKGLKGKFNVEVIEGDTLNDNLWKVLRLGMHELGSPFHDKKYLDELVRAFSPNTHQVVVYDENRQPIAATLTVIENGTAYLLYSITLKQFRKDCVGNLILWSTIKSLIGSALDFDFGRSLKDSTQEHFKMQWGATRVEFKSLYQSTNKNNVNIPTPKQERYARAAAVWKRTPFLVTDFIGPRLIRGIA